MESGNTGLAVIFSLLSALGFASGIVLVRIGTQQVSAPTATFLTVLTGAILVLSIAFALNWSEIKALPPTTFGWFTLMGAIAYPVARVLRNTAITLIGASRAAPMTSLQPIFALALGVALLGERPNLLVNIGTPMVVGGLVLVFLTERSDNTSQRAINTRTLGYLTAAGGAAAFASRDVIGRHVVTGVAPPVVAAGFALAIGGCILLAIFHQNVINDLRRFPGRHVAICGLAGIFQGLAIASLLQALSLAPVTVVSPIGASSPLFTLILAHLFLQRLESISLFLVAGTLLSVVGVAVVVLGASNS